MFRTSCQVSKGGGHWLVTCQGARTVDRRFRRKESAIRFAVAIARLDRPARVLLRREDGSYKEYCYGPASLARPSRPKAREPGEPVRAEGPRP